MISILSAFIYGKIRHYCLKMIETLHILKLNIYQIEVETLKNQLSKNEQLNSQINNKFQNNDIEIKEKDV